MSSEIYELNCPFCDKLYKLPRDKVVKHVGKSIHCRRCFKPFSIPALPPEIVPDAVADDIPVAVVMHAPDVTTESELPPLEPPAIEASLEEPAEAPADELKKEVAAQGLELEGSTEALSVDSTPFESLTKDSAGSPAAEHPIEEPHLSPSVKEVFADYPRLTPEDPISSLDSDGDADGDLEGDSDGASEEATEPAIEPIADSQNRGDRTDEIPDEPFAEPATPVAAENFGGEIADQSAAIDDPPPASTYFAAGLASEETIPDIDEEPVANLPLEKKVNDLASDSSEDLPGEAASLPVPPAPAIALPASNPPKPRLLSRTIVTPIFDPVPEEPAPRLRGRFVENADVGESTESMAAPFADTFPGSASPPVPARVTESALIESRSPNRIDQPEALSDEELADEATTESKSAASPQSGEAEAVSMESSREDELMPYRAEPSLAEVPSLAPGDLTTIRRLLGMLAVMSVIIALVLIAILLTLLGILPKK